MNNAYNFDAIGNRVKSVTGGLTLPNASNYSSNALNQYTATPASAAAGGAPKYDDDGNLETDGDRWDYTWDAENRLYSMQERGEMGEGTQRIEFRYDHLSRRYWKQTFTSVAGDDAGEFVWQGSDAMTFVYDGWNCIEQTSATNTFHADFLWGTDLSGSHQHARRFVGRADGGGAAAQRVSSQVPAANQRAGGVGGLLLRLNTVTHNAEDPVFGRSYPTYDGNGNVSEHARRPVGRVDCPMGSPAGGELQAELRDQYLDAPGAVAAHFEPERSGDRLERSDKPSGWQSHQYDAFGRTTTTTSVGAGGGLPADMDLTQLDEVHRFSTKPFGLQTGLYYYGYRYYDPVTGRWPSRDPIAEKGGINFHALLHNDPINFVDFLGLSAIATSPIDRAGYDASREARKKTKEDEEQMEYCGLICCKDGKVESTAPHRGSLSKIQTVRNVYSVRSCDPYEKGNCASVKGYGWQDQGTYHSHPDEGGGPSGDDHTIARSRKIPSYVGVILGGEETVIKIGIDEEATELEFIFGGGNTHKVSRSYEVQFTKEGILGGEKVYNKYSQNGELFKEP